MRTILAPIASTHLVLLFLIVLPSVLLAQTEFQLGGQTITVSQDPEGFTMSVDVQEIEPGVEIATLTLSSDEMRVPDEFALNWNTPSQNIAGYWSTSSYTRKTINPDWWPTRVKSMLASNAPVICLFGHDQTNRYTYAVSDALNTTQLTTAVREEDGMIYNSVVLFSEPHNPVRNYSIELRLDLRTIDFSQSLDDVAKWWASHENLEPLYVPEAARVPVYSTWYSYHQSVSSESILSECRIAKSMGFDAIIVDDGWQTMDANRGYAYTGDWEPERLPDMNDLVRKVHDLGMKFILWYAVPFTGEKSKGFASMEGKFLRYWDGQGAYVLDPRYPEVREHIISTYVKAVNDWDLDGFKLDFIARFVADQNTVLTAEDGRDFASVNEATDVLMTDLVQSLKAIKPDILIEFRQPYIGPAMRKYGNMFRAGDCPNLAMINRLRTTDLRLLSGNTAVHSDMIMWHYNEPVETAALQLLNIMFSVPQISVRLADIPAEHVQMMNFYLDYWRRNKHILLNGTFRPVGPLMNYPQIYGQADNELICCTYSEAVVKCDTKLDRIDVINATASASVVLDVNGSSRTYELTITDVLGKIIDQIEVTLEPGVHKYEVPQSGMISLRSK